MCIRGSLFLIVDVMSPAASSTCCLDFPAVMDCALSCEPGNPLSVSCFCQGIFITATRKNDRSFDLDGGLVPLSCSGTHVAHSFPRIPIGFRDSGQFLETPFLFDILPDTSALCTGLWVVKLLEMSKPSPSCLIEGLW